MAKCYLPLENSESTTDLLGGIEKVILAASDRHMPTLIFHFLDHAMLSLIP